MVYTDRDRWSRALHELISNCKKNFYRRISHALEHLEDFFLKKSNECGLLTTKDNAHCSEFLYTLHVKRRGDFGTFCLVLARAWRDLNLSRRCLTCFCLCKPGVRRVLLQSFWKVIQKLWSINHNLWSILRKISAKLWGAMGRERGAGGKIFLHILNLLMECSRSVYQFIAGSHTL